MASSGSANKYFTSVCRTEREIKSNASAGAEWGRKAPREGPTAGYNLQRLIGRCFAELLGSVKDYDTSDWPNRGFIRDFGLRGPREQSVWCTEEEQRLAECVVPTYEDSREHRTHFLRLAVALALNNFGGLLLCHAKRGEFRFTERSGGRHAVQPQLNWLCNSADRLFVTSTSGNVVCVGHARPSLKQTNKFVVAWNGVYPAPRYIPRVTATTDDLGVQLPSRS